MSNLSSPPRLEQWRTRLQQLRQHPLFEGVTVAVIILSALSVGAKSYTPPQWAMLLLGALDYLVTLYFLAEISVRYFSTDWRSFWRSGWNIFDFCIVAVSLIPLDESEYALLARLLRLFRVFRLIFFVPQLRLLVEALLTAIPRMGYVVLMMFVIFYLYAAIGNLFFAEINEDLWGNVGIAMLTLFRVATLEDWTDVMYETMEVYPFSWIFYLSFIFLSAFVFLNMMIGVVINVMQEAHEQKTAKNNSADNDATTAQLREINARLARLEELLSNGNKKV